MMEDRLKHINDKAKPTFEQVIDELRNIEYALNYYIKFSQEHKHKKRSRIYRNESIE